MLFTSFFTSTSAFAKGVLISGGSFIHVGANKLPWDKIRTLIFYIVSSRL
jgi:hypothetical protein